MNFFYYTHNVDNALLTGSSSIPLFPQYSMYGCSFYFPYANLELF